MKEKPYDPAEIERLKLMLEAEAKEGHPLYFEVKVDDHIRIHRTNKVERFDDIHNFINEDTERLIITTSPDPEMRRKDWNKFTMRNHSMNGVVDVDAKVEEKLKAFREKMAAEKLQEELNQTKEQLEQAEEYIDKLLAQLEELKVKPNHIGPLDLGKLASNTIEGIAINYPKVFENVPVLNGIAKTIQEGSSKQIPQDKSMNGQVSFTPLTESTEQSEHDEAVKRLSDFIGQHFDDNQKQLLGSVIVALGENPTQLPTVAELLGVDPNQTETE